MYTYEFVLYTDGDEYNVNNNNNNQITQSIQAYECIIFLLYTRYAILWLSDSVFTYILAYTCIEAHTHTCAQSANRATHPIHLIYIIIITHTRQHNTSETVATYFWSALLKNTYVCLCCVCVDIFNPGVD